MATRKPAKNTNINNIKDDSVQETSEVNIPVKNDSQMESVNTNN